MMNKNEFFELINKFEYYDLRQLVDLGSEDYDCTAISKLIDINNDDTRAMMVEIKDACDSLEYFYKENDELYHKEFKCFCSDTMQNAEFWEKDSFESRVINALEDVFYNYQIQIISDSDLKRLANRILD